MTDRIKSILEEEASAINSIPIDESFEKAITLIHDAVHNNRGKLITSGMGKAGQIALNISTTFSSTGTPATFLHPSDAQHGDIGVIQKDDILFLVSNSGKTQEIVELVDLCKNIYPGLKLIVLTGKPDSPLGNVADVVINTGNPKEVCPLGLTPTTSMTTMNVIGDVLTVLMMDKINFTAEDYSKRHHGGYLGSKSRAAIQK